MQRPSEQGRVTLLTAAPRLSAVCTPTCAAPSPVHRCAAMQGLPMPLASTGQMESLRMGDLATMSMADLSMGLDSDAQQELLSWLPEFLGDDLPPLDSVPLDSLPPEVQGWGGATVGNGWGAGWVVRLAVTVAGQESWAVCDRARAGHVLGGRQLSSSRAGM